METHLKAAHSWLQPFFDKEVRLEIQNLIDHNPDELKERFYKPLEFGTGGMRGIMGNGTNRINKYTLGKSTQGLSNYLKRSFPQEKIKVVIAYDCRHNSDTLSQTVAEVFSSNGIEVYRFSALRTTPELSFAVRHLRCHAGIVLTASHNPPEYNGYKVYWNDGGQIVPPEDKAIIQEINAIDFEHIRFEPNHHLIHQIDHEVDEAFFNASVENGNCHVSGRENLKIVFTSIHGTSITAIPEVLKRAGYTQVHVISEQATPDGSFPTVASPNPEEPEALKMALEMADKIQADIVIGTDPDSDRLGIAVRDEMGKMTLLNGNQTMVLMTRFLLEKIKTKGFKGNEFIATTIVSTPMLEKIAHHYGVGFKTALTGFKWIGKMIKDYPNEKFIGGGEESFGYMVGDFVRDKDAVTATLLACEIAADAKFKGSSFYKELLQCYIDFGFYKEKLISLTKKGISGAEEIQKMLKAFKDNPPTTLYDSEVIFIEDYNTGIKKNLKTGEEITIELPKSNVLIYETKDGTRVAARPSGTEPKVKFYMTTNAPLASTIDYKKVDHALEQKLNSILNELGLG